MTDIERFWSHVERRGPDECWLWLAAKNEKGYGITGWRRGTTKAHRVAFLLESGDPGGFCVLHRCDVPACVNPAHLFIGTRADNNADMLSKGRHRRGGSKTPKSQCRYPLGAAHHNARLDESEVSAIRAAHERGAACAALARSFGLSATYVWKIAKRNAWAHVV